ncbi:MAG: protein NO VEIN domain-containing protein [Pirellulaceae bacterium]
MADGVAIPNPRLPKHVIRGFKATSSPLIEMTPADVRALLRDGEFEDVEYSNCDRDCFTRKEWLLALLKYCLSDKDYADFVDVPLALMCDGLLRQYDQSDATWLYLGTKSEKSLLWDIPDLFLDDEAAKLGLEQLPNVSSLGLDGLIKQLPELFCTLEQCDSVECRQGRDDLPTYDWLAAFYNHCSDVAEEEGTRSLANRDLTKLPLVPDTDGRLWAMGLDSTPVYLPATRQPRWLLDLLVAAEIPIVSTAGELGKAIARFKSAFGDDEIVSVSPDWLIETAAANSEILDVLRNDSDVAAKFLAFVMGKELSFNASQRLPELPVFPLVSGGTTALHEEVYQSTGFVPPQISSGVALLFTGDGQLKPLYDKLGVKKLTQARFVLDFVLGGYAALTEDDQLQALCWLKDNYYTIVKSIADDKRSGFANKIRTTELIRCDDGKLHSASEVYHPECKEVFRLLGSAGYSPDLQAYSTEDWLEFFETLGMERHTRPSDLVRAIDCLVDEPLTSRVASRVQRLAKFIETNWETLHDQEVGDNLFSEALSQRRWLPPISTRPPSIPEALFLEPEERLYAPSELACRGDLDLVSSVLPVCRFPIASEMAGSIGHHSPTAQTVLTQFDNVIEACAQYESVGKHEARILKQIYGFIGNSLDQPSFPVGKDELAEKYCDAYCLIDGDFKLWTPHQTFRVSVPYFLHLRQQIRFKNESSERCLDGLGRKQSPTGDDFRAFIESYHESCGSDTVPKSDRKQIREAYLQAGRSCKANELSSSLVYSSTGRLRPASDVLVDDAPWLSERAKEAGIEFLHKDLGAKVAVVFGVGQLSQVISERIEYVDECDDDDLLSFCRTLNQSIHSPQFAKGLLRLLPFKADVESEFKSLREFEVVPASSIQTVLCWDGQEVEGSDGETEFVFERNRIYVTDMPESVLRVHVADAITKQIFHNHTLSNETYVSLILAESTNDIELVLTRLRVPDLPAGRVVSAIEDDDEFVDSSTVAERSFEASAQRRKTDSSGNGQSLKAQKTSTATHGRTSSGSTPTRSENEPPKVRTGTKKSTSAARPRTHRAVTYVAGEQANGSGGVSRDTDKRSAVDAAAIERVEQVERQQRIPTVMPHFNKGYDVESRRDEGSEIERYIEVKGLGGAWNEFGIKLTPAQVRFGSEKGDSHWLYIVEFALDPDRSVIHMIQNPVKKITDYRFDAGCKQLAEESTSVQCETPEVDCRVRLINEGHGTIAKLRKHGELMRLTIKMDDGRELKRNYPSKDITVVED